MKASKPMPALIETVTSTIRQSLETLCENEPVCNAEVLSSEVAATVCRVLQQSLLEGAQAGLAQFIESYDTQEDSVVRNGKTHRFKDVSPKSFLTVFGPVEIRRRCYAHWAGGPSVVPLDENWAMNGRYATPEVTGHLLLAASMLTASEVGELVGRLCPYHPSTSLIQDLINQDGAALQSLLAAPEHAEAMRPVPDLREVQPTAVAVSMDGANVLMREAGAKPGRPAERPRPAEGSSGSCSYRNAMVGSISFYRELEDVINIETGAPARLSERIASIYHARMPEPQCPSFKREFEQLVSQSLEPLPGGIIKILLMDGARSLWSYARGAPLFEDFKMLVDFYHASEHLSALAEALFGKQSTEAQDWYEKWRYKLKYEPGAITGLLRSSARYTRQGALSRSRREQVGKEENYFRHNRERMNYHEFVEQGLPIGSGPVEAACKTIVKARMCQSGMRWSRAGGQNVLTLRTLAKSGHWDSSWKHYQKLGGFQYVAQMNASEQAA